MDLGILLRKLRINHGYSQQYVANSLEISRNAYMAWEKEGNQLTISKLQRICDLYNISLMDLLLNRLIQSKWQSEITGYERSKFSR